MKTMKIMNYFKPVIWIAFYCFLASCSNDDDDDVAGQDPLAPVFTVTQVGNDGDNQVKVVNDTPKPYLKAIWDTTGGVKIGQKSTAEGEDDEEDEFVLFYSKAGTYKIKLTILSTAGSATKEESVTFDTDGKSPNCPDPDYIKLAGKCGESKTWYLSNAPGTTNSGPSSATHEGTDIIDLPKEGSVDCNYCTDGSIPISENPGKGYDGCFYNTSYKFTANDQKLEIKGGKKNPSSEESVLYSWLYYNQIKGLTDAELQAQYQTECGANPVKGKVSFEITTTEDEIDFGIDNGETVVKWLDLGGEGFLGVYEGEHRYQILKLTDTLLYVRAKASVISDKAIKDKDGEDLSADGIKIASKDPSNTVKWNWRYFKLTTTEFIYPEVITEDGN